MGKDNRRQRELMLKALELARDDPGKAKGWYLGLGGADKALLDSGLREITGMSLGIQSLVNAPKPQLEQAIAAL